MTRILNLGFVGGGVNSAVGNTHFIASQMDGRFQVKAGCFSRHPEINRQTSDIWHIDPSRTYETWEKFLVNEAGNLDAVVVLTPTPEHFEPVIKALELGYPVICEKALASSSQDALLMKETQTQTQGFLTVTYNYTGYPMLRELKSLISQGKLGLVEQVHVEMPQEGFTRLNREGQPMVPQEWRLHDEKLPTLSLDLGVHVHNIVEFLTGEKPIELVAMQSSRGRFRQVLDNTICMARYSNNLECSIWFSKSALGYRNGLRVRVFGEVGSAEWHQMEPEFLTYHDNYGHKTIIDRANVDVALTQLPRYNRFKAGHPAGFLEAFANLYWDIGISLESYQQQGRQVPIENVFSVDHAIEGLLMLEAMAESSQNFSWQAVNKF